MIKRYLKIIFILTLFHACAQEKKAMSIMDEITLDNIVEKWRNNIKHYDVEPFYKIHSKGINCDYEILVNDFPLYKSYDGYSDFTGTQINLAILKSGEQTVTIKVFPLKVGEMLTKETNAYFKLVEVDNTTNHMDEKTITSLVLPSDTDGNFTGAGLPYFEKTITFNATVPYELTGWSNSQDLSKLDQEKLQKRVKNILIREANYFINKNNLLFRSFFEQFKEINQSEYKSNSNLKKALDELKTLLNYASSFNIPKNVMLKLYCNNRVVTLEYINGKRRGKSFFDINMEKGDMKGVSTSFIYFHIPKGKTELEIIR